MIRCRNTSVWLSLNPKIEHFFQHPEIFSYNRPRILLFGFAATIVVVVVTVLTIVLNVASKPIATVYCNGKKATLSQQPATK